MRRGRRPPVTGLLGRELPGARGGADLDLARLGLLADRDAQLEHAVGVAGPDRVRVQGVREPDAPSEAAEQPLAYDPGLGLGALLLAGRAHAEHPPVAGHVNL